MSVSRRNFLLFSPLLLSAGGVWAQQASPTLPQTSSPVQFRLTVWTIRPRAVLMPTFDDLNTSAPLFTRLHGFDKPEIQMATDAKLLEAIRKANPQFSIPQFEQKAVVLLSADMQAEAPLKDGVRAKVKVPDKETALTEIGRTHGKEAAAEFQRISAQEKILYVEFRTPHLNAEGLPLSEEVLPVNAEGLPTDKATRTKGYRSVKLGTLYSDGSGLTYNATLVQGPQDGMPAKYNVRQEAQDILLFCLEAVPAKSEKR